MHDFSLVALSPGLGTGRNARGADLTRWPRGNRLAGWPRRRSEVAGAAKRHGTLALSPDGRLLAVTAARDREVLLQDLASGKARALLAGHKGTVTSLAFSPDGKRLATGAEDNVAYVWDVTGEAPAGKLSGERLDALWSDLHSPDAGAAFRAVWRLADDPERSAPFLRRRLPAGVGGGRAARLIDQLDADSFQERQAASAELARLGVRALPALARTLKGKPSLEVRRRLAELLKKLPAGAPPSARLVGSRAVEALEKSRSRAARAALEALARTGGWREEAGAALRRLRR
jgi:hypothetical protein